MKKVVLWILVVVIVLSFLLTFLLPRDIGTVTPDPVTAPRNDTTDPNVSVVQVDDEADQIVVSTPAKGATVTTPLTIKGKARGNWYFEGTFPVQLIDASNALLIAEGTAKADGNWMTDDFVNFTAQLKFTKPPTATQATLMLRKDNPSGLPENDASILIPVVVK